MVVTVYLQPVIDGLKAKNHTIVKTSGIAVVESIRSRCDPSSAVFRRSDKCIEAVSDARSGGSPDGY